MATNVDEIELLARLDVLGRTQLGAEEWDRQVKERRAELMKEHLDDMRAAIERLRDDPRQRIDFPRPKGFTFVDGGDLVIPPPDKGN